MPKDWGAQASTLCRPNDCDKNLRCEEIILMKPKHLYPKAGVQLKNFERAKTIVLQGLGTQTKCKQH